jgi:ribose 5-phosphate isomerase A
MSQELIEQGKKEAAETAVLENVTQDMVLGIGSGSTVVYAVKKIAEIVQEKQLNLTCIPTSFQSYQLIVENGLILGSLDQHPSIDVDIDGADEIDADLNLIKGGGGCLVQEKIIASNSERVIIIADFRKNSLKLGEKWKKGIPVEVIPMAYVPIMRKMKAIGGKPKLRMASAKAGPLVTDNGNFILDVDFGILEDPSKLNQKMVTLPGIVDTGLFIDMTEKAYIGNEDGSVSIIKKE